MANGIPSPIGNLFVPESPAAQVIAGTFRGIEEILRDADRRELMMAQLGLTQQQIQLQSQQFKAENALADRRLTELIASNKAEREFREDQAERRHGETMRALDIREATAQAQQQRAARSDALQEFAIEQQLDGDIEFVEGPNGLEVRFTPRAAGDAETDGAPTLFEQARGQAATGQFIDVNRETGEVSLGPLAQNIESVAEIIRTDPAQGVVALSGLANAIREQRAAVGEGTAPELGFEALIGGPELQSIQSAIASADPELRRAARLAPAIQLLDANLGRFLGARRDITGADLARGLQGREADPRTEQALQEQFGVSANALREAGALSEGERERILRIHGASPQRGFTDVLRALRGEPRPQSPGSIDQFFRAGG